MATTTPERNINESVAANVSESAVARHGIPPTIGDDFNSPMRRLRLDLTRQTREEKKLAEYYAWLEKLAYAMLRINPFWLKILIKKLPARSTSLNPRLSNALQVYTRRSKRKSKNAKREHNKKAKKATDRSVKQLQIDFGPFNPYIKQKDRQLTTEEKRIHLDHDHYLNEPSKRPFQDACIIKRELDTNSRIKVPLPPRPTTNPVYRD